MFWIKEMECDGLNSELVLGLDNGCEKGIGLGLDEECVVGKAARVEKMDGEKSVSKKRFSQAEIGLDADDDEPIGSLLKLKPKRNPKKVKVEVAGGGGGKGKQVKVRADKFGGKEEDLGGMEDTLACFKKKLKAPKKTSGSASPMARHFGTKIEPLCPSLNDPVKDMGLVSQSISKFVGKTTDDDGFNANVCKGSEKSKRSKTAPVLKIGEVVECGNVLNGSSVLDGNKSEYFLAENENKSGLDPVVVPAPCMDEHSEDSLSTFFRNAQSVSIRKSHSSLRSKEVKAPQASNHGLSPKSGVLKDFVPLASISQSASKLINEITGPGSSSLHASSCGGTTISTYDQNQIVVHKKDGDASSEVLNCMQGIALSGEPKQELSSALISCQTLRPQGGEVNLRRNKKTNVQRAPFGNDSLRRSCEASLETNIQISNEAPESLASPTQDLLAFSAKKSMVLEHVDGLAIDRCLDDTLCAQLQSPYSAFHLPKREITSSEHGSPKQRRGACNEEPDIASASSQKEDASMLDCKVSPLSSRGGSIHELASQQNHLERSMDDVDEELPSIAIDQNERFPDDTGSMPDPKSTEEKQLIGQRAGRNTKRHWHGDMFYEGDDDWEILIHEQDFLASHQIGDNNQSALKTREKTNSRSTVAPEIESGGAAAVSAGLKARAAGPVEKIKFKEVLKRKGGHQEYIKCRNQILHLWNKNVNRILPLSECGVSDIPDEDEPPRNSLIRDIYAFLDHYGYINVGVASEKGTRDSCIVHNVTLSKEKASGPKPRAPATNADDGVSFILGGVKISETSVEDKDGVLDDLGVEPEQRSADLQRESSPVIECKGSAAENNLENGTSNLDLLSAVPCTDLENDGRIPPTISGLQKLCSDVHSSSFNDTEANQVGQCNSETRKKIIVVGAGPAGLTAARHLQRQGFHVTVLEARNRLGGRVFTDRSSLSVPVDLGASIITGVEADVDTERRPDPSSLVCSQLGLELTVLNSDCPLYDIVTGQKVPADLDEALEAEYNSLLDDTLLLVDQKGDHATGMSLEDGLEYALKMRRMARSGRNHVESEQKPAHGLSEGEILSPLERRVMDWHFANLEYGCAALLNEVSLPHWNQDDEYGGFGGAHCMIKGGYSNVVESLGEGLRIHLNHVVTNVSYPSEGHVTSDDQCNKVKVSTSNGKVFSGDAVLITVPLGCLKAETLKFSPPLPQWKCSSIQRLGYGVLNKVVLEFPEVFWDDSVDYFGATAQETNQRGQCFMFWNVKKTVGAPVLISLVVGKAAINSPNTTSSDHVNHAVAVLRKLFGQVAVPDPVASVVTDWGRDPFSYGAYSYVAVGASGEDYDILGRPVENCLFFAGEATCKEHPDTVGGAMMSGLREAVRIVDILSTGNDYTAEVEAMEAAQRQSDGERNEVRDIIKRLDAIELSNVLYKNSLDGSQFSTREGLLQDMFSSAKTAAGRLHLVKELVNLPVEVLKSFAGTKEGLSILNSWILDSMGKDGTQLLRHCVRLLVLVSTDLLAVRLSGIGKTVKEKVCVHTSRDIRAIASQLVSVWVEIFRKEKASNSGLKLLRQSSAVDTSKSKPNLARRPPLRTHHATTENKANTNMKKLNVKHVKHVKVETRTSSKSEVKPSKSQGSVGKQDSKEEEDTNILMSEEEQAAFAAAEAARAAARAAAEAYASSGAMCNTSLQLPKIPSFHKFARREQFAQMDDTEFKKKWSGGALGKQDCVSEIDSRNCRVRDWTVDFGAAGVNVDSSKMSVDNRSQRSHSNENASQLNYRDHSGESAAVDSSIFTKAWVDSAGSEGLKDYSAIDRWQSQAAAADSDFYQRTLHIMDEGDSHMSSKPSIQKHGLANESSISQVTVNKELASNQPRGADNIKQAVVDYVASLLMPLYKARKIDKEGYKSIMKKTATKVMEHASDAEKAMAVFEFLDFKRKNKIRAFVDQLIERHMEMKPHIKS